MVVESGGVNRWRRVAFSASVGGGGDIRGHRGGGSRCMRRSRNRNWLRAGLCAGRHGSLLPDFFFFLCWRFC